MKKVIIIILIIILILLLWHGIYKSKSFAIELSKNSSLSTELVEKIATITKNKKKVAYLTFDDGPTTSVTPKILDILKAENVKASFFVIGKYVDRHPEIVKRAYEEGHYIANHGYDHNNSNLYKSSDNFIEEVQKTDSAIGKAIGVENYCAKVFHNC